MNNYINKIKISTVINFLKNYLNEIEKMILIKYLYFNLYQKLLYY